jgi:hypothetical protein
MTAVCGVALPFLGVDRCAVAAIRLTFLPLVRRSTMPSFFYP